MHRVPPDHPVRRRLFADDEADEARIDNFANILQETITADRAQKSSRWNFDFVKEEPLEGDYEWYRSDGRNDWIGIKPAKIEETIEKEQDSFLPMKMENEITPKCNKEEENAPLLRKRRSDVNSLNDKGVKRKISFD